MTLDGQRQANECELQRVTPAITALPIEQQRTAWDISIPCCEIASCARRGPRSPENSGFRDLSWVST